MRLGSSQITEQLAPTVLHGLPHVQHRAHPQSASPRPATALRAATYRAPSSMTGATELEALSALSEVVPDTWLSQSLHQLSGAKAATVSALVLVGLLRGSGGHREYEAAIERALTYDKCLRLEGQDRLACFLDRATINVGAMFAKQVEGRVSTEVDPRGCQDKEAMVQRAKGLAQLYEDMGIPREKFLIRLPATWASIAAAKELEQQGIRTHLILVYSFVQAVAAAQAGVSVIQPNIGRLGDWYKQNPGAIKDPRGPREDSGFTSGKHPGVALIKRIYDYCSTQHPDTKVMVSGIREKEEALQLAGVDYLVVGQKVLSALGSTATMQGYNDGFTASSSISVTAELSPETVDPAQFAEEDKQPVTEASFKEGLGPHGLQLLERDVKWLISDVERLEPYFQDLTSGRF